MKTSNQNNILTIFLDGRIDSGNAEEKEKELNAHISNNSFENLVLDIDELEYISSAGLRMVLRTRKNFPSLKIINASSEVYEILDMTGFTEMITVEKAYRKLSVDGCKIIGKGAKGTVYRYDADTIVKVYKNADSLPEIKNERELARKAFVLGIPTAIPYDVVKVGNCFGSVFELLDAKSYSTLIAENPEKFDNYVSLYAELLRTIHSTNVKKGELTDFKLTARKWVDAASPYLKTEDADKLSKMLNSIPDTLNIIHCDCHTNNIMMQNDETLLIDMDTLSQGHPIFELANIHITYVGFGEQDSAIVENFLGLPYDIAIKIWNAFLPLYLETQDEDRIKEVEDKVKVLSYTRLIRHMLKRGATDTEDGRRIVGIYSDKINKLLESVDSLDF